MMYLNEILVKNVELLLEFLAGERGQDTYLFVNSKEDYLINDYIIICKEEDPSLQAHMIPVQIDEIDKIEKRIVLNARYLEKILKKLVPEDYARYLQIRYSENDWVIHVNGIELFVLEKKVCKLISEMLSVKKAEDIQVAFHIVDHCNLNCQMCNKFSPLAKEKFVMADGIIKDAYRLAEITGRKIRRIVITGGEPLLHPELEKILEGMHKAFPECEIQLQTNGIKLMEKTDSFFKLCQKTNTFMWITQYPISFNYSEIISRCERNQVRTKWAVEGEKSSWKFSIDVDGNQKKYMTLFCWMHGNCINVLNGKMYPCGFMHASIRFEEYFGYQLERDRADYLDLYSISSFEDCAAFLSKIQPFCRYCNIRKWEVNLPWKTSNRKVNEWV